MTEQDVEAVWTEFWEPLLTDEDGNVDIELVKAELFDFYFVMNEASKVYCYVTGDTLSKTSYYASSVISVAEERTQQRIDWAIEDFLSDYEIVDPR